MKLAVCLFGRSENYKALSERLKKYNPDFYLHTWESSVSQDVLDLFQPIAYKVESPKAFKAEKRIISDYLDLEACNNGTTTLRDALSYYYTRKESFDLLKSDEYDVVISCRFDIYNWRGIHVEENHLSNMNLDVLKEDMNFVYSKSWPQLNAGMGDHWFVSNVENIRAISKLYDHAIEYLSKDSEFRKAVFEGWPLSNQDDEFSNEILNPKKIPPPLYKPGCPAILNNHYIYKWHFIQAGLLKVTKFV